MGLDVIASNGDGLVHDEELEQLDVIRGMFTLSTPDGQLGSAIRGKAYEHFLDDDNSLTLYDDLSSEQCREVAAEFRAHAERLPDDTDNDDEFTRAELETAARWFELCADKGYGTKAWS